MAYQFDIDSIQDFFEQLATSNADVKHNVNGNKSFARFESDAQVNEIRKAAGKNIVVVADTSGQRVGDKDDRKLRRELLLRFAVFSPDSKEESKKAAVKKAEEIMFDFMTAMEKRQGPFPLLGLSTSLFRGEDISIRTVAQFLVDS